MKNWRPTISLIGSFIWPTLFCMPVHSAQALELTEFGMLTVSNPSIQSSQDSTLQSGLGVHGGGGLSLGFRISYSFEIETGFQYFGQNFSLSSAVLSKTSYTLWTAQIPLLLRYSWNEKISFGTGAYFNIGTGNITATSPSGTQYWGYQDLGWASREGGLCLSLKYRSPLSELISFIVDLRGLIGISNRDQSSQGSLRTQGLQLLAGISFIL